MSAAESAVIRDPDTRIASLAAHWGVDPDNGTLQKQLGGVEVFLRHAALDYDALLRLLNTRFVNPDRLVAVTFAGDPPHARQRHAGPRRRRRADRGRIPRLPRSHAPLRPPAAASRLERIRARHRARGARRQRPRRSRLPAAARRHARRSANRCSWTPEELSGWWSGCRYLSCSKTELPSRYEEVFLNPRGAAEHARRTGPDLRNDVFALNADRTDLAITIVHRAPR